jgi:hypothetical protein
MVCLGDTFWARNPNSNNPEHLFFVIATPAVNGRCFLLVNMTKRRVNSDTSCILTPGDHPCVTNESVIQYSAAICAKENQLQTVIQRGTFRPGPKASIDLITRIQASALSSDYLRQGYRALIEEEIRARGEGKKL